MYSHMFDYLRDCLAERGPTATKRGQVFAFRDIFTHTVRVYKWAKIINEVEKGDPEIVEIASIFHDIGKGSLDPRHHGEVSAEICAQYLRDHGFPEERILRICSAVTNHSDKLEPAENFVLEDRIVMDADSLDEVGVLSLVWDAMAEGSVDNSNYYTVYERAYESYLQLCEQTDRLKTKEGLRLYKEKLAFMELLFKEFRAELHV